MKLSTIIISLLVLTGCAASVALMTMNRSTSESREPWIDPKPQVSESIEATGGGARSPAPVAAPAPAALPPIPRPEAYAIREKTTTAKKATKVKPNPEKVADDIISQLEPANMVFSVDPRRSNIADQISVTMLIDVSKNIEELKSIVKNAEIVTASNIEVSKVVVARVIAPDFNVIAITPEEQPISHTEVTQWEWELIPLRTGKHQIHVTVNAEVNVDGVNRVRNIETFRETVEIEITLWQVVKGWISQYWQWSFSTLLLPLGLWYWKRRESKT